MTSNSEFKLSKKHLDFERNKRMIEDFCEKNDPFRKANNYDPYEHDIVKMTAYDTNLQVCYLPAKKKPLGNRCCIVEYNKESSCCSKEAKAAYDFIMKISHTPLENKR